MYKPLKYLLFVAMIILAVKLMAHEFWLQPSKFIYKMGDVANVKFNVGENFNGDNWVGNHDKINQLLHVSPKGLATDISERLGNNKGDSVQLSIMEEGTHMILFNSKNSFIKLKAEKFNDYLKEDGLQTAIDYRKLHNEDSLEGKEYYQRSVKTILQCGNATTNKCTRRTQLPLDIVPEINPYEPIILGRVLEHNRWYTIYFNKKPLPKVLVRYWCKKKDGTLVTKQQQSNKKGKVMFEHEDGQTMISCVYMERIANDTTVHWQSYWGSASFEYRKGVLFAKQQN